jgi:hypothetical protein
MTDMQRYSDLFESVQPSCAGEYVLASDAEAAIAAAEHSAFAFGIKCAHKGRKRGEEDMLAKCIAEVEGALIPAEDAGSSWNQPIGVALEYLAELQTP